MKLFLLILTDVLLGYVPQAAGCAICLFTITKQKLNSRKYWITAGIFSAIAIIIRTAFNIGLIDFGFHTVIIWSLFIIVAIFYNRLPAMQSICSILLSGIIIAFTEILTAVALIIMYGNDTFTAMMNNTQDLDGKIVKAICGIPANIMFVIVVWLIYIIRAILAKRKEKVKNAASVNP